MNLINLSLDNVLGQMRDAIGTQGSFANRLNQSIDQDGNLKVDAVNETMHSIEDHTDTDNFVRMSKDQSDKLDNIASEATNLGVRIFTDDTTFIDFTDGVLVIKPSTTVTPSFEAPDILKLNMAFPSDAAHQHFYGQIPVDSDQITPDYTNYKITSTDPTTSFIEGSLRVYINGTRIFEDIEVYAPGVQPDMAWTLLKFTGNATDGTFALSVALSESDIIRIDFDVLLT